MARKSTKQVMAEGGLKTFVDRRLIMALGHPIREHILAVLNERIASATQIGKEIGLEVEAFYHHFEVLEELGCIELVETRRGNEHFFRAKTTLLFDDRAWRKLPATVKHDLTVEYLQLILEDAAASVESGIFNARDDRHISWIPGEVDEQGWIEGTKLMEETLSRAMAIHRDSAVRISKSGEKGIQVSIVLLGFETSPQSDDALEGSATS